VEFSYDGYVARILVLSPFEPPADGIAKHTAHLVDAWNTAGHNVFVIAPGKRRGPEGRESIGPRSTVARIVRQIPQNRTWKEAAEFAPDIVFVQFAISTLNVNLWAVRSLCKQFAATPTPVVVGYHEPTREYDLLKFVSRQIYRAMAQVTDVPIVFSSAGRQTLTESGLFDEVVELPHGTVGVANITDNDVARVRALYDIRKPLVLTLGFTSADKGTDILLDAVGTVAANRGNEVQFLIAGSPRRRRGVFRLMERRDVKYQRQLKERAKRIAGVDIAFSSYIDEQDVAALLFVADVVALPYRRITQSGIANLALSSRSVVVCSDLPGLRSNLGDAAIYAEVDNSSSVAERISSLLGDNNASLRRHMRELSAERAVANTYTRVAEEILSAGLAYGDANSST